MERSDTFDTIWFVWFTGIGHLGEWHLEREWSHVLDCICCVWLAYIGYMGERYVDWIWGMGSARYAGKKLAQLDDP